MAEVGDYRIQEKWTPKPVERFGRCTRLPSGLSKLRPARLGFAADESRPFGTEISAILGRRHAYMALENAVEARDGSKAGSEARAAPA